jgi:hypothetical protein
VVEYWKGKTFEFENLSFEHASRPSTRETKSKFQYSIFFRRKSTNTKVRIRNVARVDSENAESNFFVANAKTRLVEIVPKKKRGNTYEARRR